MLWLFSNAKWVAIGIALASLLGYIEFLRLDVAHQKKEAVAWEAKYTAYRAAAESNAKALGSANQALTLQAKQSSIEVMKLQNDAKAKLITRINNDPVSASIRVPASVLQLQHDTTTNPTDIGQSSSALGGHAPDTEQAGGSVADLLRADSINNSELNSCVDEVIKWNKFWDSFVNNVKAVETAAKN